MHDGQTISDLIETVEKKVDTIYGSEFFKIALSRFWMVHPELFALSFPQLEEKHRLDIVESAMILRAEANRKAGLL